MSRQVTRLIDNWVSMPFRGLRAGTYQVMVTDEVSHGPVVPGGWNVTTGISPSTTIALGTLPTWAPGMKAGLTLVLLKAF